MMGFDDFCVGCLRRYICIRAPILTALSLICGSVAAMLSHGIPRFLVVLEESINTHVHTSCKNVHMLTFL